MYIEVENDADFFIAMSTKADGNMAYEYDDEKLVTINRQKFFDLHDIVPELTHEIKICHSTNIDIIRCVSNEKVIKQFVKPPRINSDIKGYFTGSDGCLTCENLSVALLTADCIPLMLWHTPTNLHGIVHVGLLGAINGIVLNLQDTFEEIGVNSSDVNYYVGPGIMRDNYNISKSGLWRKIKEEFETNLPHMKKYVSSSNEGDFFDLHCVILDQLKTLGTRSRQIQIYPDCTTNTNGVFFSHYVATQNKMQNARFLSVIGIKPKKRF